MWETVRLASVNWEERLPLAVRKVPPFKPVRRVMSREGLTAETRYQKRGQATFYCRTDVRYARSFACREFLEDNKAAMPITLLTAVTVAPRYSINLKTMN